MRFGILGPLQVVAGDGRELTLRSGLQRMLLAALLLRANQMVSSDQLIEDLWAARAPAGAAKALQVHVSRLRRALDWEAGAGCPLATYAGGYLLRVDADQLDSVVFERLLDEGKRLVATGDPAAAADLIRQALGLWRGSPLADLTTAEFAQAEIRRLEELRLAATMERIDADLVLGADAPLIPELEALVESNPLQERLRAQLMRALYQAGRQADALAVYRETSALLREELGLEPSRQLQELERMMLRQDTTLEAPSPVARGPGSNLPRPATPFVGRARELAERRDAPEWEGTAGHDDRSGR